MEIRDLESLRPLVASSLRSAATAQGPRLSKSRISTDSLYNLYLDTRAEVILDTGMLWCNEVVASKIGRAKA